jgi:uncharacterized membrane protein
MLYIILGVELIIVIICVFVCYVNYCPKTDDLKDLYYIIFKSFIIFNLFIISFCIAVFLIIKGIKILEL